jgi:environmental stress-induced protein Ves
MMQTVSLAQTPPQPWRNGGGVTQELLAWPAADAWHLRVSVARIDRDGPFSAFDGIDRWFTVLHGSGVVLGLNGGQQQLTADSAPLHFDGAEAPSCTLLDGPTQDLNLMLKRDAGTGAMQLAQAHEAWLHPAPWRALFVAADALLQVDDRTAVTLPAGTLAWDAHAAHQRWVVNPKQGPLRAWWLHFIPQP